MKAKDFIIIGGLIALYYLYQKNKTKASSTSTEEEAQDESTSSEGVGGGGGGGMSMPVTPIIVTPIGLTTSGSLAVPIKVKDNIQTSKAIYTGIAPSTVTPILPRPFIPSKPTTVDGTVRSITNPAPIETPIEVAIQQGGASTLPRPNIASEPSALNQNELINQNITPIVRGTRSI